LGRFDPADLRDFLHRPWHEVRAEKERYWADQTRLRGPVAGLRAGEVLMLHVRAIAPDWPTPADRDLDYLHHLRLVGLFERAAHAFPRR
jgi:hypothetical protein